MEATQEEVRAKVRDLETIAATLNPKQGSVDERQARFEVLRAQFAARTDDEAQHWAKLMASFQPGLFVTSEKVSLPADNLALERFFRLPKGHERHVHGRRHAGVRIVQDGPTLIPTLDAHHGQDQPLLTRDLIPYRAAQPPASQQSATARRRTMLKARSKQKRPLLLADLERRYSNLPP